MGFGLGKQVCLFFVCFGFLIMKWRFWYLYQIASLARNAKPGGSLACGKWETPRELIIQKAETSRPHPTEIMLEFSYSLVEFCHFHFNAGV